MADLYNPKWSDTWFNRAISPAMQRLDDIWNMRKDSHFRWSDAPSAPAVVAPVNTGYGPSGNRGINKFISGSLGPKYGGHRISAQTMQNMRNGMYGQPASDGPAAVPASQPVTADSMMSQYPEVQGYGGQPESYPYQTADYKSYYGFNPPPLPEMQMPRSLYSVPTRMNSYQIPSVPIGTAAYRNQQRTPYANADLSVRGTRVIPEYVGPEGDYATPYGTTMRGTTVHRLPSGGVSATGYSGLHAGDNVYTNVNQRIAAQLANLGVDVPGNYTNGGQSVEAARQNYRRLAGMRRAALPSLAQRRMENMLARGYQRQLGRFAATGQHQFLPAQDVVDPSTGEVTGQGMRRSYAENARDRLAEIYATQQARRMALQGVQFRDPNASNGWFGW